MIARGVARLAAWSPAHLLARAGFCAKAALYADIGLFALHRAWARHGPLLDVKDALVRLARSPFGPAPAAAAGVGIACLGAWFTVEAIVGTPGRRGPWAALSRVGALLPGGAPVLAAVGIGLLAYAAYAVVEASARRFPPRAPLTAPSAPRRSTARTPADRTAS